MTSLAEKLTDIVGQIFEDHDLPRDLGAVRVSDRPDLAQFQCNGAMAAARIAKKKPREIASAIVETLKDNNIFDSIDIAGPGFINLNLTSEAIQNHLHTLAQNSRMHAKTYANGETLIVDYVGANIAKAMHAGHIRPTIIGDCIKRIMAFAGYKALGDVHLGDWGLPIGQIISAFELSNPEWAYFDDNFAGNYPIDPPFEYSDLERIYPEASNACKADKDRMALAQAATAKLQDGHAGYIALWKHFLTLSKAHIKSNTDSMNVHFEIWKGEADVNDLIPPIAEDLKSSGILYESDGAWVIDVKQDSDKKELPPLIYYKSNGAVTYGTTDLATIYDRKNLYGDLARIIYVVDKRQNLHFEQVFRAAAKAGYTEDNSLELHHIGFGTLNGADGKPFKTRSGELPRFDMLVSDARQKARDRIAEANLATEFSDDEKEDIARKVAMAALKFTDLLNQPHMDYVFDLDRMSSFEGKTGPYLLYQAVRINSLLRKAKDQDIATSDNTPLLLGENDTPLALILCQFPDVFDLTYRTLSPHYLCDHAYSLAQEFSRFYAKCHILSEEDETLRLSRLRLCEITRTQLGLCLSLLGIDVPDRM